MTKVSSTPPPVTDAMIEAGYLAAGSARYWVSEERLQQIYLAMNAARSNQEADDRETNLTGCLNPRDHQGRCGYSRSNQEATPDREVAWLVECPKYHPGTYFALCDCGCGRHHWTKNVHKATKFPTKEDAETTRGGDTNCIAVEHVFGLQLPAKPVQEDAELLDLLKQIEERCHTETRQGLLEIVQRAILAANQEDAELEADRDEWKQQHENLLSVRDSDIAAMVRGRDKWMLLAQRTLAYLPSSLGIAKAIRAEIDPVEIDAALARSEDAALTTKGDGRDQ